MLRPIDVAMASSRPAKVFIRKMWIDHVVSLAENPSSEDVPLYLTLCGREGFEIGDLIDRGVLHRTPSGSIAATDGRKVVAVEADVDSELALRRKYPGLKVINEKIEDLVDPSGPGAWPPEEYARVCRAKVVNLDLTKPLYAGIRAGNLFLPAVQLVGKFAQLHGRPPRVNWTLFLTLNSAILWSDPVARRIVRYLAQNLVAEPTLGAAARPLLGETLFEAISKSATIRWTGRRFADCQHVLMILVPKNIVETLCAQGWRIRTTANYAYGGSDRHAPMVTWMLQLEWEGTGSSPARCGEGIRGVLGGSGRIAANGTLS